MVTQCFNLLKSDSFKKTYNCLQYYKNFSTNTLRLVFLETHLSHRHSFYLITILTKNERIFAVLDRKFLHKTAQ